MYSHVATVARPVFAWSLFDVASLSQPLTGHIRPIHRVQDNGDWLGASCIRARGNAVAPIVTILAMECVHAICD